MVFQAARRSNKSSTILQDGRFAETNESRFQASNSSNVSSAVQHLCRNADARKYRIPAENRSKMRCTVPLVFDLQMLRNNLFKLRKFQMWAVPSRKDFDLLIIRIRVFRLRIV